MEKVSGNLNRPSDYADWAVLPQMCLEQTCLVGVAAALPEVKPKVLMGETRGHPSARRAVQKTNLQEIGLVDLFNCVFLFADRRRKRAQSHRPTIELLYDRQKQLAIDLVEPVRVDFHAIE